MLLSIYKCAVLFILRESISLWQLLIYLLRLLLNHILHTIQVGLADIV